MDLEDQLNNTGKRHIEGATNFNGFDEIDQDGIISIYKIKKEQNEFEEFEPLRALEECAKLYRAQKVAFQDIIAEKGFDVTSEVPRDYSGRIAFLTHHGTFAILGKYKNDGRHVAMTRIHTPTYSINGKRVHVAIDMELGHQPHLTHYKGSELRALAVNPRGADGDELEDCASIATHMGMKTAISYIKETDHPLKTAIIPSKIIEIVED